MRARSSRARGYLHSRPNKVAQETPTAEMVVVSCSVLVQRPGIRHSGPLGDLEGRSACSPFVDGLIDVARRVGVANELNFEALRQQLFVQGELRATCLTKHNGLDTVEHPLPSAVDVANPHSPVYDAFDGGFGRTRHAGSDQTRIHGWKVDTAAKASVVADRRVDRQQLDLPALPSK